MKPLLQWSGGCFRAKDELSWSSHLQITQLRVIGFEVLIFVTPWVTVYSVEVN
jgi:hypothetical protein